MKHTCRACGDEFRSVRSDARYCSATCRQRAARARKVNAAVSQPTMMPGPRSTDAPRVFDSRPYVSSVISDAHEKWLKGRGTTGETIRHPSTGKVKRGRKAPLPALLGFV